MIVLGVDVDTDLLRSWQGWLAPDVQPFFVESLRPWPKTDAGHLSPELRDTYKVWKLDRSLKTLWLDEDTFFAMSRSERAALVQSQVRCGRGAVPAVRGWSDLLDPATLQSQAGGYRFVWWPSLLAGNVNSDDIVARAVTTDGNCPPSRHREVTNETWGGCAEVVPAARSLAVTFPPSSGPNCFGTVMGAAGVHGAADEWMLQQPFLDWLGSSCRPARRNDSDDDAGTVLVWRNREGLPVHAAVTIGDRWAFEKPAQAWSAPRVVLTVKDLIRVNRCPGQRLERHRIHQARWV